MYSLSDLIDGIRRPYKLVRELNLLYHRRLRLHDYNRSGMDIFSEDWDNLVLLDACRYDEFEHIWDHPGQLEYRESRGSSSNEFVRGNFRGRELLDTVCITANGWYLGIDEFEVHDLIPLVEEEYRDDETGTVLPETVTKHARKAAEEYPNKRLVVHYMQPHTPYLGPTGREYFEGIKTRSDICNRKKSGEPFRRDQLWKAYRENLELVVEEVIKLLDTLEGKTVISADHGELLGERLFPIPIRDYMHPHGIDIEELIKIPWLVYGGDRRRIVAERPRQERETIDDATVEEHLKELGYLQ